MTATPKKAAPRKALPKPPAPAFEQPDDDHAPSTPASAESEETGHRGTVSGPTSGHRDTSGDLGVSGQPAEYTPPVSGTTSGQIPDSAGWVSEAPREPRESPAPGTERHAEIVAQTGAPLPVYAGTFAIYNDPKDQGGYILSIRLDDGTEQLKRIPSAVVALANGGGGLVGRLTGLGKLFG